MKKLTKLLLPLISVLALSGCGNKEEKKPEEESKTKALESFERVDDLYRFKTMYTSSLTNLKLDIDSSKKVQGNSSLKLHQRSGTAPEFAFPFSKSESPDVNIIDISSISMSIFNGNDKNYNLTTSIYTTGYGYLLSNEYVLKAKEWNNIDFKLSSLALESNKDSILGFSIKFSSSVEAIYYVDNIVANMGAVKTAEDVKYDTIIKEYATKVSALPTIIESDQDVATAKAVYKMYASLPDLYRRMVPTATVERMNLILRNIASISYGVEDGSAALPFGEFYGTGLVKNKYTSNLEFTYSEDVKYGNEPGSLRAICNKGEWNYIQYSGFGKPGDFDTMEVSFYFETDNPSLYFQLWFNWNQYIEIYANQWMTLKFDASKFQIGGGEIDFIQHTKGNPAAHAAEGSLYISSIIGHKSTFKDTKPALSEKAFIVGNEDASEKTVENNQIFYTLKNDEKLELQFDKTEFKLGGGESFFMSVYSPTSTVLSFYGFDSSLEKTVNLNKGWNRISLLNSEYNSIYSLSLPGKTNRRYGFANILLYKTEKLAMMNMMNNCLALPESIDENNVFEIMQIVYDYKILNSEYIKYINDNFYPNFGQKIDEIETFLAKPYKTSSYIDQYMLKAVEGYISGYPTKLVSLCSLDFIYDKLTETTKERITNIVDGYHIAHGNNPEKHDFSVGEDYPWEGAIYKSLDDEMGIVYTNDIATTTKETLIMFDYDFIGCNPVSEFEDYYSVAFYVYNPTSSDLPAVVSPDLGGLKTDYTGFKLKSKSWTKVEIATSTFSSVNRIWLYVVGKTSNTQFKLTYMYGVKAEKLLTSFNKLYNATDFNKETFNENEKMRVLSTYNLFDSFADAIKQMISEDKVALMEKAYNKINDLGFAFSFNTKNALKSWAYGITKDFVFDTDTTYGSIYNIYPSASKEFSFTPANICDNLGFDRAFFYFYNSQASSAKLRVMGGDGNGWVDDSINPEYQFTVPAKTWTKIDFDAKMIYELGVEDWQQLNHLYFVLNFSSPIEEKETVNPFKMTNIYGYMEEK